MMIPLTWRSPLGFLHVDSLVQFIVRFQLICKGCRVLQSLTQRERIDTKQLIFILTVHRRNILSCKLWDIKS